LSAKYWRIIGVWSGGGAAAVTSEW
jgi:hypothetical protein